MTSLVGIFSSRLLIIIQLRTSRLPDAGWCPPCWRGSAAVTQCYTCQALIVLLFVTSASYNFVICETFYFSSASICNFQPALIFNSYGFSKQQHWRHLDQPHADMPIAAAVGEQLPACSDKKLPVLHPSARCSGVRLSRRVHRTIHISCCRHQASPAAKTRQILRRPEHSVGSRPRR
jgi:hypothetical protein